DKPDMAKAQNVLEGMRGEIGFADVLADENIGKLSIVGVGMRSHSGIAAKVFEVLAAAGVNIQMISTSEIKISVVIAIEKAEEATRAVHDAFLS
ncbi:MAG: ACT domain-containing protein, partial [Verrucomicrobiota bacterium]|nr:ACT domain-containing protein [Verrucomicrobiota bacterium]